jgi:hypothetical protein
MNTKCVICFSLQLLSETLIIQRISQRNTVINVKTSLRKVILLKFECSWEIFGKLKKSKNVKFHQNPSSRSRVVRGGQTDGWQDGQTDKT